MHERQGRKEKKETRVPRRPALQSRPFSPDAPFFIEHSLPYSNNALLFPPQLRNLCAALDMPPRDSYRDVGELAQQLIRSDDDAAAAAAAGYGQPLLPRTAPVSYRIMQVRHGVRQTPARS